MIDGGRALSDGLTEAEQQARNYRNVVVVAMGAVTVLFGLLAIVQVSVAPRAIVAIVTIDVSGFIGLWLARHGHYRSASVLLLAVMMGLVGAMALSAGGIRSPGMALFLVFTLLAALLLGKRAAVITAVVCGTIATGLAVAEIAGLLPPQEVRYKPVALLILNVTYLVVMLAVVEMIVRSLSRSLSRAERELVERQRIDADRERLVIELRERVKELRLLQRAANLLQPERPFTPELVAELVALIPPAWMYPEICVARIRYGDMEAASPEWRETEWRQTAGFRSSIAVGTIEVAYVEPRPQRDEGPFLREERSLIESLAEMLQAHIERDIAERNREVMERSLRQAQKMDALGTLAGGIAHDFNNILMAIGGNAELGLAQTTDPALRESLSEIRAGYARARDLVKRILIFSRRQESSQSVIDLGPVAREAAQLLKASLPPRIGIRTRVEPDAPTIRGDASQIHQIVMNLGTNAAHAMRSATGGLDITIEGVNVGGSDAVRLDLPPGRYARLAVRDTGTGMAPEVRERLFEPFFTTKGLEGTGLGLAVVHGLVRDHRGAIDVTTALGSGTTVAVYFPAVASQAVVPPEPEPVRGEGQRVMYVDDDVRVVHVMSRLLSRLGYEPEVFSDPVKAIDAFGRSPFAYSAVITDMAMPVMNGVEVAAAIHAVRADIPVALASGYGADDRELMRTQSIAALIQKPVSMSEISRVLGDLVRD